MQFALHVAADEVRRAVRVLSVDRARGRIGG